VHGCMQLAYGFSCSCSLAPGAGCQPGQADIYSVNVFAWFNIPSALVLGRLYNLIIPQAGDALRELPQLRAEHASLEARYAAAVELVGERDEQLEELANDLSDVKVLYKAQIEALLAAHAGDDNKPAG
jgi:TATA element modulatory factor 1 TATA binding